LGIGAILALALAFVAGSALAPTPLDKAEPVPDNLSAAVIGLRPSSTVAAAEDGGAEGVEAFGTPPAAPPAPPALAGLKVFTPAIADAFVATGAALALGAPSAFEGDAMAIVSG